MPTRAQWTKILKKTHPDHSDIEQHNVSFANPPKASPVWKVGCTCGAILEVTDKQVSTFS